MPAQSRARRILLTRPAGQGARFARDLADRFGERIALCESPLLRPRLLVPDLPDGRFDAVLFTSETAVAAAAALRGLPRRAFAVGDRTADVARRAGFDVQTAAGDAAALVALVVQARPARVLHLHGQDTRGEVVPNLRRAGIPAEGAVVYVQDACPLTPDALAWLAEARPVIAPLFSPRSAALFALAARGAGAPLILVSLSPAVDAACPLPAERRIAARPDANAMIAALAQVLDAPQRLEGGRQTD